MNKIVGTVGELLGVLRDGASDESLGRKIRKNKRQITHRLRQKLISMSVGRIRLSSSGDLPKPMCWSSGFAGLQSSKAVLSWLKVLDRQWERQIARVGRRLASLAPTYGVQQKKLTLVLPYYGAPFSYWGQFKQKSQDGRPSPFGIPNPKLRKDREV